MTPEFSRRISLAGLPPAGREERLAATPAECAALARRVRIPAVNRLAAVLRLRSEAGGVVRVEGRLSAEVVQDCVVSLEPVTQAVEEEVTLRILPPGAPFSDDPEAPDEIESEGEAADLGEALAEQLALALDPYPRAPGARLEAPGAAAEADPPRGPFAGLAALRGRG
jgi:uncharacterized metal-binding protein YceD (DUF177 family)